MTLEWEAGARGLWVVNLNVFWLDVGRWNARCLWGAVPGLDPRQ